ADDYWNAHDLVRRRRCRSGQSHSLRAFHALGWTCAENSLAKRCRRNCRGKHMKHKVLILVVVVVAGLAVAGVYAGWFHKYTGLQGYGTVEARNIRVGSKVGGRILQVLVREGDRVQPNQTLITFDDKELEASLQQARANAEKAQRGYRPEEIEEA